MSLILAQDPAHLKLEFALHLHLGHSLGDADVSKEPIFLNDIYCLLKIPHAMVKHAQLLEAQSNIVVDYVREIFVSPAATSVSLLYDDLGLHQEEVGLVVLALG